MPPSTPIPVTLLAGFLGSGKTTLLNRILQEQTDTRFAIMVNDFGDLNVDADLVIDRDADVLRLEGGCICCTMQSGLTSAAMHLVGRDVPPEHIIIEASGISDPMPIAAGLMMPGLQKHLRLDSVLTVIDAERAPYPNDNEVQALVESQIKTANIVLLNKADLVDDVKLETTRQWIKDWTPGARILETTHADAPLPLLLDTEALPSIGTQAADSDHDHAHDAEHTHPHDHDHDEHDHSHPPAEHNHEASFRRWTYRVDTPFTTLDAVQRALRSLPDTILRVKGFIVTEETRGHRTLLQMAGRRASFTFHDSWDEAGTPPHTHLVALGLPDGPSDDVIQDTFDACLAGAAAFTDKEGA